MLLKFSFYQANYCSLFLGILGIAFGFLAASLKHLVILCQVIQGLIGGPILAAFFMGMLTHINTRSMIFGLIFGFTIAFYLSISCVVESLPSLSPFWTTAGGCVSTCIVTQNLFCFWKKTNFIFL